MVLRYVFGSSVVLGVIACTASRATNAPAPPADAGAAPLATASPPADAGFAPELVEFPSGSRTLHGFLWRPPGAGPFPAIVYNHGSEDLPGTKPGQAEFFVPRGYVVFVPHRRGQGRSKEAGTYINDFYFDGGPQPFTDELVAQTDDVTAAVAYLGTLPYVDRKRVAAVGCSLGGIESLFAAERVPGIVAAIDFAGASATWAKTPPLQEQMKTAATNAKVPVFFIQAENDFDTTPSKTLSALMTKSGKKNRVHIFPPNGTSPQDGHAFCGGGPSPPWGEEVLSFLHEAGM